MVFHSLDPWEEVEGDQRLSVVASLSLVRKVVVFATAMLALVLHSVAPACHSVELIIYNARHGPALEMMK